MFEVRESESWAKMTRNHDLTCVRKYLGNMKRKIFTSTIMPVCNRLSGLFCWTPDKLCKGHHDYSSTWWNNAVNSDPALSLLLTTWPVQSGYHTEARAIFSGSKTVAHHLCLKIETRKICFLVLVLSTSESFSGPLSPYPLLTFCSSFSSSGSFNSLSLFF